MAETKFFCIRGHMKSGTNWVCRLLNLHPEIHSHGEFHWHKYFEAYQANKDILVNVDLRESKDPLIRRALVDMVKTTMRQMSCPDAKFIGDRTPHMIHPVVLPRCPHISVVRDCRDVLVSRVFHQFNAPRLSRFFAKHPKMQKMHEEFKEDPWYFQKHPERLLSHEKYVRNTCAHWANYMRSDRNTATKQTALPVMFVKYENLHLQVDSLLNKMFEFIGADPALAAPIPDKLRPGHQKENPNKFDRKGQVGDWQNYMTPQAKQWINEEAGSELIKQGYVQSLNWTWPQRETRMSA
jgi:hypothetical protein